MKAATSIAPLSHAQGINQWHTKDFKLTATILDQGCNQLTMPSERKAESTFGTSEY